MENKTLGIISIVCLLVIVSSLVVLAINKKENLSPEILENCKTISYKGDGKINLVFFSDEETAKEYSEFLLNTEPFSENKNAFNIFYIDDYAPKCELYKNIAILCYSKELIKKSASCPNDFIIVPETKPSNIRSSAYMNVVSINTNSPKEVLVHEFGHVFANLADEYVPATLPRKSENCVKKCENFDGKEDSCEVGCSKENYYRSINTGVMRTLSSKNYGTFNEEIILKNIPSSSSITGNVVSNPTECSSQKYALVEGIYQDGKVIIKETSLARGCVGNSGTGNFDYSIILSDNSDLAGEFNPELIFTDAEGEEQIDGSVLASERNFLLKIPIIENAKTLKIILDSQTLAEVNLENLGASPCKK